MTTHAIVLRIRVVDGRASDWITDALGECARELEAHQADDTKDDLGLVADLDDPGRCAWEIVTETYGWPVAT